MPTLDNGGELILSSLPIEIASKITKYLDCKSLVCLARSNKATHDFACVDIRYNAIVRLSNKNMYMLMSAKFIKKKGMNNLIKWYKCKGNIDVQKFRTVMMLIYNSGFYDSILYKGITCFGSITETMLYITKNSKYTNNLHFIPWIMITTFVNIMYKACTNANHRFLSSTIEKAKDLFNSLSEEINLYWIHNNVQRLYNRHFKLLLIIAYYIASTNNFVLGRPNIILPKYQRSCEYQGLYEIIYNLDEDVDSLKIITRWAQSIRFAYRDCSYLMNVIKYLINGKSANIKVLFQSPLMNDITLIAPHTLYANRRFDVLEHMYYEYPTFIDKNTRIVLSHIISKGLLSTTLSIDNIEAKILETANLELMEAWETSLVLIYNKSRFDQKYNELRH